MERRHPFSKIPSRFRALDRGTSGFFMSASSGEAFRWLLEETLFRGGIPNEDLGVVSWSLVGTRFSLFQSLGVLLEEEGLGELRIGVSASSLMKREARLVEVDVTGVAGVSGEVIRALFEDLVRSSKVLVRLAIISSVGDSSARFSLRILSRRCCLIFFSCAVMDFGRGSLKEAEAETSSSTSLLSAGGESSSSEWDEVLRTATPRSSMSSFCIF